MFKLVVLCAFLAAAAAKPGLLIPAPITQYSYLTPGLTSTISKSDSSVIHPSPLFYQAPYGYTHFIKKRSAQFPLTYASPAAYYPQYPNYVAATTYNSPLIHSASILPGSTVHLIKKRSAATLIPTTYFAPGTYTSGAPLLTSTYTASAPLYSQHLISHPLTYTHLIKKRSAPLLTAYAAPGGYSHQSRFDLQTSHTPYTALSYASPFAYSSPLVSHVY